MNKKLPLIMKLVGGEMFVFGAFAAFMFLLGSVFCSDSGDMEFAKMCRVRQLSFGSIMVLSYFVSGLGIFLKNKLAWVFVIPVFYFFYTSIREFSTMNITWYLFLPHLGVLLLIYYYKEYFGFPKND